MTIYLYYILYMIKQYNKLRTIYTIIIYATFIKCILKFNYVLVFNIVGSRNVRKFYVYR